MRSLRLGALPTGLSLALLGGLLAPAQRRLVEEEDLGGSPPKTPSEPEIALLSPEGEIRGRVVGLDTERLGPDGRPEAVLILRGGAEVRLFRDGLPAPAYLGIDEPSPVLVDAEPRFPRAVSLEDGVRAGLRALPALDVRLRREFESYSIAPSPIDESFSKVRPVGSRKPPLPAPVRKAKRKAAKEARRKNRGR